MHLTADEASLSEIADWGPTEDCSDWADAARRIWFTATLAVIGRC